MRLWVRRVIQDRRDDVALLPSWAILLLAGSFFTPLITTHSSSVPAGTLPNSTVPSCKANKTCIPTIEEYDNVHEGVPPMKQYNWPECNGP